MKKLSSENRIHSSHVPVIAITGGIGTGKSTILKKIQDQGHFIISADQLIKEIYQNSDTIKSFVEMKVPDCIVKNEIDFKKLRENFFSNQELKKELETMLYRELPNYFESKIKASKAPYIFYEIPLLFEKKLQELVDYVVVVYAPKEIQIKRIAARDNSDEQTIQNILAQQIDIEVKVPKADFVINTHNNDHLDQDISELILSADKFFSKC